MQKGPVFIILIFFSCSLFASNPLAYVYQVDDPILLEVQALSLGSGINAFSSSGPISGYELSGHLKKIDRASLSSSLKTTYDRIDEQLQNPLSGRIWDVSLDAVFEAYGNTNSSLGHYEWVEEYTERQPFLYAEAETVFGDHAYGIFSYALQDAFSEDDFSGIATNNPFILDGVDFAVQNTLPHTAFLGFSNEWGSIIIGRDAISLGRGNTGNLMLGSHVPYHDFFQGGLFNSLFKYTFLAIPMNQLITQAMIDDGRTSGNLGEAWIPWKDPSSAEIDTWHTLFNGALYRVYIAHRLEVDFFPWWRLSITEGTLFYVDTLDPRIFSPLQFNHNLQNFGEVNNSIGFESEITLSSNWMLDIQFFLDQFQTGGEQDTDGTLPPNALALLVGSSYRYEKQGWVFDGFFEGVYTSPFAYLRTGDHTDNYDDDIYEDTQYNLDFVHAVNMEDRVSGVDWLGYVYGPDSIVLAASLNASSGDWSISPSVRYMVQGERGLMIEGKEQLVIEQLAEDINMLSPSGNNPMHSLITGIGISRSFPDIGLQIYTRNYWVNRWDNSGHTDDFQLMVGMRYSL